jgi:DNA (cytosine-5)-methyltransferase 1
MKRPIKYISLFSGAMGLDLGLEQVGFKTAVCNELDPEALETIRHNRPRLPLLDQSITEISGQDLKKAGKFKEDEGVPLVVGGPPCQAFSVFGNRKGLEDRRGQLVFEYVRAVSELKPSVFLMENVRGLLSMAIIPKGSKSTAANHHLTESGSLLRSIFEAFNNIGYRVDCFVVNVVNYGAPQIRERIILIGNRHNLLAEFPAPTHSNRVDDDLPPFKTLGETIGKGFCDPCPEVMNFSPRKLKYLSMVPPGGNWRSLTPEIQLESMGKSWYLKGGRSAYWRKLSFAFPSPTVVTMPNHAGTSMCHPSELRAISVGEAAAIQEFPSDWHFCGTTTAKFRQIGNAVPTRLGNVAGGVILDLLQRIKLGEKPSVSPPAHRIVHIRPHVRTRTFWKNGKVYAGDHSYYGNDTKPTQLKLDLGN